MIGQWHRAEIMLIRPKNLKPFLDIMEAKEAREVLQKAIKVAIIDLVKMH